MKSHGSPLYLAATRRLRLGSALLAIGLAATATLNGCGNGSKTIPSPPNNAVQAARDAVAKEDDRVRAMTAELKTARTAMREAQLRAEEAQKAYEQAPTPKPDDLRTSTAKADADVMAELDKLRTEQVAQQAAVDALRDEIAKLKEAREKAPNAPTTPSVDETINKAEKTKGEGKSESDEATKALAQGVATALCAAYPAVCPALPLITKALEALFGSFGSAKEYDAVSKAVTKVASGEPLTPEEAAALFKGMQGTKDKMPPHAFKMLLDTFVTSPGGSFKEQVEVELEKVMSELSGSEKAIYDAIKAGARGDPQTLADIVKGRLVDGMFLSSEVKELLLDGARLNGATPEVLAALRAIPNK